MAMTREALCRTAPGTRGLMAQPRSLDRAGPALFAVRRQAIRRTRSLAPEPASCIAGWYATQARNGAFSLWKGTQDVGHAGADARQWPLPHRSAPAQGTGPLAVPDIRRS